jgi:hypothetical protein
MLAAVSHGGCGEMRLFLTTEQRRRKHQIEKAYKIYRQ